MLIFTDNVNIFCYLFNPKCATFTFNNVIIPQINAKYKVLYHAKNFFLFFKTVLLGQFLK